MFNRKQYIFNPETLSYEAARLSVKGKIWRTLLVLGVGVLIFMGYFYLYTNVLGMVLPKTAYLEERNKMLLAKVSLLNQQLEEDNKILSELQRRDNIVYRPIFGMDEISSDVRDGGFGGVERYAHLEHFRNADQIISSVRRIDILSKKAYIQSRSFDEVAVLAKRAGDMASCVPTIFPVSTAPRNRLTSSFGYRKDPFNGNLRMHSGVDIAGTAGEVVYATGMGKVAEVSYNFFGYGNYVIIDHGFGYKTRYAHLKSTTVTVGQTVKRGDQIGNMGNSGRSKGVHLHYEVIYKDRAINPWNYFTNDLSPEEYQEIIRKGRG